MSPEAFRNILFALCGLSFGAATYALGIHLLRLKSDFQLHIGFALVKLAWLLAVGMVFESIIVPLTALPPSFEGYVFMVGLALGAAGFILVARASRRKWL